MHSNNTTINSHWQQSLQRMSRLLPEISPAQRQLLEHAVQTGASAKYLAHQMNKSPSTVRNQIQSIRQKAAEVGYGADTPWTRILFDAVIYFYLRGMSSSS